MRVTVSVRRKITVRTYVCEYDDTLWYRRIKIITVLCAENFPLLTFLKKIQKSYDFSFEKFSRKIQTSVARKWDLPNVALFDCTSLI